MKYVILLVALAAVVNSAASKNEKMATHRIVTVYEASHSKKHQLSNETANRLATIGRSLNINSKPILVDSKEFMLKKITPNRGEEDNDVYRIIVGNKVTMTSEGEVKHLHLKKLLDDYEIKAYLKKFAPNTDPHTNADVFPKAWGAYKEFSLSHEPGDAFENILVHPKQKLMLVKEEL